MFKAKEVRFFASFRSSHWAQVYFYLSKVKYYFSQQASDLLCFIIEYLPFRSKIKHVISDFSKQSEVTEAAPLLVRLKQLETNELQQAIWNMRSAVSSKSSRSSGSSTSFVERSLSSDTSGIASLSGLSSTASLPTSPLPSSNSSFRTCLTVALHAAVECTCDINASVRHLALQTLSEVAQVIGLFDHTLLVNIIMTHMSFEPTILTYGCLEILLNVLVNLKSGKVSYSK
ncbi:unnamed protein product [Hydatigera taeniaeformis]|uniref:HEAT repeat-containing protein 1 n=1 Tax=Hydatigena taeniaeformis TaxID=6205 RepID=A0A0R3WSP0_HYDTA|nr:unnamed protein product [Hydatigera taeniaeformis]